jgi:hypothetical protein
MRIFKEHREVNKKASIEIFCDSFRIGNSGALPEPVALQTRAHPEWCECCEAELRWGLTRPFILTGLILYLVDDLQFHPLKTDLNLLKALCFGK